MTLTQDQVEEIAGRLTKAQRACILAMTGRYQRASEIPASGRTLHSLWDWRRDWSTTEGCVAPPVMLVSQDVYDYPLGHVWDLTDLGLAVRSHLEKRRAADG